jgi:hypothetical protein
LLRLLTTLSSLEDFVGEYVQEPSLVERKWNEPPKTGDSPRESGARQGVPKPCVAGPNPAEGTADFRWYYSVT